MSYCRFAWDGSDVYIFESDSGIECCSCGLTPRGWRFVAHSADEMRAHIAEHRAAGDHVPPIDDELEDPETSS